MTVPSASQLGEAAKWVTRATGSEPDDPGRVEGEMGSLSQGGTQSGARSRRGSADGKKNRPREPRQRRFFDVRLYSGGLNLILVQFSKGRTQAHGAI